MSFFASKKPSAPVTPGPTADEIAAAAAKKAEEDRLKNGKKSTDTVLTQGLGDGVGSGKKTVLGA